MDFFFGFLDEIDSISTGSDFSSNEGFEGSGEFNFEFVKSGEKFVEESFVEISSFINLVFKDESFLFIVYPVITNFFRSSSGGTIILSKFEEVTKGLFLEHFGVSTKFGERFEFSDFSERMGHSSGLPVR